MKNKNKEGKQRLLLRQDITMCTGGKCALKKICYRYMLNDFYDKIAKRPPYPAWWFDPVYDKKTDTCDNFRMPEYM